MIKINEKTRRISPIGVVNVKSDLKAHRLPFICKDRVTENVKLSECSLWINYKNGTVTDRYAVTDLAVNGDNVTFSWLLGGNATAYNGETQFTILAEQTENGEISLAWNTVLASFKVEDAIEAEYTPRESQQDVFEQLLQMVSGKQDKLTAGDNITIEGNVISATGGGGNVDFDDTITQDETTGKYGIDFSQYNSQEASWANDGKAIKSNDMNAWRFVLAQSLGRALDGKQDTLDSGDITTSLIADNNVTESKLSAEVRQKLNSGGGGGSIDYIVNVKDHGAYGDGEHDDAAAIQSAIEYAKTNGGIVFLPEGTYNLVANNFAYGASTVCLQVYEGQTIIGENAVLVSKANRTHRNTLTLYNPDAEYGETDATGYTGIKNVTIKGLTFDSETMNVSTNDKITYIRTTHADGVLIENCTFKNCALWHCIEMNSTINCRIIGCKFEPYRTTNAYTEAIQLDAAVGEGNLGADDGTVCKDVEISGCLFNVNDYPAIGNHANYPHSNIRINDNVFKGGAATRGYINFVAQTGNVDIYENTFYASGKGIVFYGTATVNTVHDNRFEQVETRFTGGMAIYNNMINGTFTPEGDTTGTKIIDLNDFVAGWIEGDGTLNPSSSQYPNAISSPFVLMERGKTYSLRSNNNGGVRFRVYDTNEVFKLGITKNSGSPTDAATNAYLDIDGDSDFYNVSNAEITPKQNCKLRITYMSNTSLSNLELVEN